MAVFGTGPGHPIQAAKFITEIRVEGLTRIITLNSSTEAEVPVGTTINFGPGTIADFSSGELVSSSGINSYETLSNTSAADRFAVAVGQYLTQSGPTVTRTWSASTSPAYWNSEVNCVITITFASSNAARHFFNSGGEVRIQSSRTGGRTDAQNSAWSGLLASAGMQIFGAQTPSTGFSPMNGTNFYRLTSSYQSYYTISSSSPYTANSYRLEAKCNVSDNSSGTATSVDFRVRFVGGYVDPGAGGPPYTNDEIDGTFSVVVSEKRATGRLVPSGEFTITSPSFSNTSITGS
jgi:hypothetical protein